MNANEEENLNVAKRVLEAQQAELQRREQGLARQYAAILERLRVIEERNLKRYIADTVTRRIQYAFHYERRNVAEQFNHELQGGGQIKSSILTAGDNEGTCSLWEAYYLGNHFISKKARDTIIKEAMRIRILSEELEYQTGDLQLRALSDTIRVLGQDYPDIANLMLDEEAYARPRLELDNGLPNWRQSSSTAEVSLALTLIVKALGHAFNIRRQMQRRMDGVTTDIAKESQRAPGNGGAVGPPAGNTAGDAPGLLARLPAETPDETPKGVASQNTESHHTWPAIQDPDGCLSIARTEALSLTQLFTMFYMVMKQCEDHTTPLINYGFTARDVYARVITPAIEDQKWTTTLGLEFKTIGEFITFDLPHVLETKNPSKMEVMLMYCHAVMPTYIQRLELLMRECINAYPSLVRKRVATACAADLQELSNLIYKVGKIATAEREEIQQQRELEESYEGFQDQYPEDGQDLIQDLNAEDREDRDEDQDQDHNSEGGQDWDQNLDEEDGQDDEDEEDEQGEEDQSPIDEQRQDTSDQQSQASQETQNQNEQNEENPKAQNTHEQHQPHDPAAEIEPWEIDDAWNAPDEVVEPETRSGPEPEEQEQPLAPGSFNAVALRRSLDRHAEFSQTKRAERNDAIR